MQTYHYGDIYCRVYSSFQRKAEQSFPFTKAKQARGGSPAQGRGNTAYTRYARSHRQGRAKAQKKGGTDERSRTQERGIKAYSSCGEALRMVSVGERSPAG